MVSLSAIVCSAAVFLALTAATPVEQCAGQNFEDLSNKVQLTPCKRTPCKLKRGTSQHITIHFTPKTEVTEVKNHVTGEVFGVPLPFVGVDGKLVCDKLETADGKKASCPLAAGTEYVYKDSFPVEEYYPTLNVKVHWALLVGNTNKNLICFEVQAQIK